MPLRLVPRWIALGLLAAGALACSSDAPEASTAVETEQSVLDEVERNEPFIVGADGDVVVLGSSSDVPLDLGAWVLSDDEGNEVRLPQSVRLEPGAELTVHLGEGTSTAADLYLATDLPLVTGAVLTLRDAFGTPVDTFDGS